MESGCFPEVRKRSAGHQGGRDLDGVHESGGLWIVECKRHHRAIGKDEVAGKVIDLVRTPTHLLPSVFLVVATHGLTSGACDALDVLRWLLGIRVELCDSPPEQSDLTRLQKLGLGFWSITEEFLQGAGVSGLDAVRTQVRKFSGSELRAQSVEWLGQAPLPGVLGRAHRELLEPESTEVALASFLKFLPRLRRQFLSERSRCSNPPEDFAEYCKEVWSLGIRSRRRRS